MYSRGPDDTGFHLDDDGLSFSFRRLSIIDVGAGHQPMSNQTQDIWVVFNGEIYNHKELRTQLEGHGHVFRTRSDTEVIVHGYAQWGERVLHHLAGMFGLAIWDKKRQTLLLARDRMGIKPLYFFQEGSSVGFASDPRALLPILNTPPTLDQEALALYLHLGHVPAPWSIYKGIQKLRPAEMALITPHTFQKKTYWELRFQQTHRTNQQHLEAFTDLFEQVVQQHLQADVPLGAFLSGGIDSTAVVQAASKHTHSLRTFTAAFDDPEADETAYAQQAAKRLQTSNHLLHISKAPIQHFTETLSQFPEPFGDSAAVPNALISKQIRKHCTVALSGDGGDEVFAGYHLRKHQIASALRRLPSTALKSGVSIAKIAKYLTDKANHHSHIHEIFEHALQDLPTCYVAGRAQLMKPQVKMFFPKDTRPLDAIELYYQMMRDELQTARISDPINAYLYLDQRFGLPAQMLTKVDVTSMAHSLEVRVPFLDHRIVEFAASLPCSQKQSGLGAHNTKRILRTYLESTFPRAFINRPKKGFGMPASQRLKLQLQKELSDSPLHSETLHKKAINALLPYLDTHTLWNLAALSLWEQNRILPRPKERCT